MTFPLILMLGALLSPQQDPIPDPCDDYGPVTDTAGSKEYKLVSQRTQDFTFFNVETVHGLARHGSYLYALNTHGSRVVRFDAANNGAQGSWPTLMNPVSVGVWLDGGSPRILVLGGATHALAIHDRNGRLLEVVDLAERAAEPGDLVVDQDNNAAWISSMAYERVVRIDLTNPQATPAEWSVDAARPRFLSLDRGGPGGSDNMIYVAPFLSGNNTVPVRGQTPDEDADELVKNTGKIVHLSDAPTPLPDEDLFQIAATSSGGAATPVHTGVSTLMTAHGRNAATGDYWMLGTDLRNFRSSDMDPLTVESALTEPAIKGDFADSEVVLAGSSGLTTVALDSGTETPASFPWDLVFHGPTGSAFISSPTGNVVRILNQAGAFVAQIDTGEGTIPRSLLILGDFLAVQCWGTNEVQVYNLLNLTVPPAVLSLGFDPTPAGIAEGRKLFYDASLSAGGMTTCNTCHPGGEYDGLAWSLEDRKDYKEIMVTQNLKSIADTFPYHWRGERRLVDFNPAFVGLLGGDRELTDTEFARFSDFIFALQSPANPDARVDRRLPDELVDGGNPKDGQLAFMADFEGAVPNPMSAPMPIGIEPESCASCHSFPNGSANDVTRQQLAGDRPHMSNTEIGHFRDLAWKDQPAVEVSFLSPFKRDPVTNHPQFVTQDRARGGYGLFHAGLVPNIGNALEGFRIDQLIDLSCEVMHPDDVKNVAAFMRMFDRGISRGVHQAYWVDSDDAVLQSEVNSVLLSQASREDPWCDVVVLGEYPVSPGDLQQVLWHFKPTEGSPGQGVFVPDHPTLGNVTLDAFFTEAAEEGAINVIYGVPAGMGRYLGGDFDYDGEPSHSDPAPFDFNDPEIDNNFNDVTLTPQYVTSNVAVYRLESPQPVKYTARWWPASAGPENGNEYAREYVESNFSRIHTVVLRGLTPPVVIQDTINGEIVDDVLENQPHHVELDLEDREGNLYTKLPDAVLAGTEPIPQDELLYPEKNRDRIIGGVLLRGVVSRMESVIPPMQHPFPDEARFLLEVDVTWDAGLTFDSNTLPSGQTTFPLTNYYVIGQVLLEDVNGVNPDSDWLVSNNWSNPQMVPEGFQIDGNDFDSLQPGNGIVDKYYVAGPTDVNGTVTIDIRQPLASGRKAVFVISAIMPASIDVSTSGIPNFEVPGLDTRDILSCYNLPATPIENRCFETEAN